MSFFAPKRLGTKALSVVSSLVTGIALALARARAVGAALAKQLPGVSILYRTYLDRTDQRANYVDVEFQIKK